MTQIVHLLTGQRHYVWFENPTVLRPLKESGLSSADERLFPRDCREGVRQLTENAVLAARIAADRQHTHIATNCAACR